MSRVRTSRLRVCDVGARASERSDALGEGVRQLVVQVDREAGAEARRGHRPRHTTQPGDRLRRLADQCGQHAADTRRRRRGRARSLHNARLVRRHVGVQLAHK